MKVRMRFWLPGLVLLLLVGLLFLGMQDMDRALPSPLIGLPAPALPAASDPAEEQQVAQARNQPHLVNFWASWCQPCLIEHPVLMQLSRMGVKVIGVNYKDDPEAARRWLARHGNPFSVVLRDPDGAYSIDWGVYGVPETYVIDGEGTIQYKRVGVVDADFVTDHRAMLGADGRGGVER